MKRRTTKTAIAYLRVSTEDQRLGPQAQRAQIEAWAKREGVTVLSWHLDQGVSGAAVVTDRPGLLAALADLTAHRAAFLVVAKRDRLARDTYVAATIERAVEVGGARVQTADGTANGETPADAFMRSILDGAAAYERALIAGRTKAALATKKARGERVGCVGYGYRLSADGVHLEPDAAEQSVVARVRTLSAEGRSVRKIAGDLAAAGMVGRTGNPLSSTQVHRMLAA